MNKNRVMALDIGDVRIGVAMSDSTLTIAQGLCYIKRVGYSKDIAQIAEISEKYNTKTIIIGLPRLMSGIEGQQAQKTRSFGDELVKNGFEVIYQDERLSSVVANDILISGSIKRKDRKEYVDKIAATIILQMWLDKQKK